MSSLTDLRYNGNRLYKKKCLISIKEGQKKDSPIKNTDESSLVDKIFELSDLKLGFIEVYEYLEME